MKTTFCFIKDGHQFTKNSPIGLPGALGIFTKEYELHIENFNSNQPPYKGFARKVIMGISQEASSISFPRGNISASDLNEIQNIVKKQFEVFDVEYVSSVDGLLNSNSGNKVLVVFFDPLIDLDTNLNPSTNKGYNRWLAKAAFSDESEDVNLTFDIFGRAPLARKNITGISMSGPGEDQSGSPIKLVLICTKSYSVKEQLIYHSDGGTYSDIHVFSRSNIEIARTTTHEIGHVFKLYHHGTTTQEYYYGNFSWGPVEGTTRDMSRQIQHWSKGEYENAKTSNGHKQDDIAIIINRAKGLKIPEDLNDNIHFSRQWKRTIIHYAGSKFYYNSTANELISRRAKLINSSDVTDQFGMKVVEGMVGHPYDTDILKIILKAGNYEISEHPNSDNKYESMLYLGLKILKSRTEVSKVKQGSNYIPFPNKIKNLACASEELPKIYPVGAEEHCIGLKLPEQVHISRQVLPAGSTSVLTNSTNGQFNEFRKLNFTIPKTCLVYLRAYGDKHDEVYTNGFSDYGSVGKYFITIRKNSTNTNLNELLPSVVPPNCYPTEKLKCVLNGAVEDKIFFTQDPGDYANNLPYDNTSDHPNSKLYKIVINGKLCEIPFLLQGKEYGLNDTIDEPDKKELFAVTSQVPATIGTSRIQEFIIAPEWDLT